MEETTDVIYLFTILFIRENVGRKSVHVREVRKMRRKQREREREKGLW